MSKWVPVARRLPPPLTDVLVAYRNLEGKLTVDAGFLRPGAAGGWRYLGQEQLIIQVVEYWMPLPAPPEEHWYCQRHGFSNARCTCGADTALAREAA